MADQQCTFDKLEASFNKERARVAALYYPTETAAEGHVDEHLKGVPNFWLTAMKAKPVLCKEINGRDEEVLKFLKDIKLCKVDSPKGFKFEFEFAENLFFKNQFLTKTYHMLDEDYMMPVDIIGTDIEWYGDKYSSEPVLAPSERSERCSRVAVGYESFFDFFYLPVNYKDADDRQIWFQHDYEIRCALQDIIHGAISYFLEKTPDFPIAADKLPYETYQNGGLEDGADDDESLYDFDCQLSDIGKIKKAEPKKASPVALGDYDSYVGSGYLVPSTGLGGYRGESSLSYPDRLVPYAGGYGGLGGFPRDKGFEPYGGSGYGYGYGSDSGAAAGYGSGGLYGRGGGYGGDADAGASRYYPYAR